MLCQDLPQTARICLKLPVFDNIVCIKSFDKKNLISYYCQRRVGEIHAHEMWKLIYFRNLIRNLRWGIDAGYVVVFWKNFGENLSFLKTLTTSCTRAHLGNARSAWQPVIGRTGCQEAQDPNQSWQWWCGVAESVLVPKLGAVAPVVFTLWTAVTGQRAHLGHLPADYRRG